MTKRIIDQRGQAALLLAIIFPMLFVLIGLGVDLGYFMMQKQKMQDAVDFAALGSAQKYIKNSGEVVEAAKDIGENNGLIRGNIKVQVAKSDKTVQVNYTETVQFFFMPIVGINNRPVSVSATAKVTEGSSSEQQQPSDFVFFAGDEGIKSSFSDSIFDGKVHSNDEFSSSGGKNVFNDDLQIVGKAGLKDDNVYNGEVIHPASYIPLPDLDIDDLKQKATVIHHGNFSASGKLHLDGIMFVEGKVSISGGDLEIIGKGSIIATGDISISAGNFYYDSGDDSFALYTFEDISLSGGDKTFVGALYAPYGEISISGGGDTFYGAVIANKIRMSSGGYHFIHDPRIQLPNEKTGEPRISLIK